MNKRFKLTFADKRLLEELPEGSIIHDLVDGFFFHSPNIDTAYVYAKEAVTGIDLGPWYVEEVEE